MAKHLLSLALLFGASACAVSAQPEALEDNDAFSSVFDCLSALHSDAESALEQAQRWVERDDGADAQQCLAAVHMELGQSSLAIAAAERSAEFAESERLFTAPSRWAEAARMSAQAGRSQQALEYFDRAFASPMIDDDMRGEILLQRAQMFMFGGDLDRAEADLAIARDLISYDTDMWIISADVAFSRGDAESGAQYLTRAYEADPTDAAIAFRAGEIAFIQGQIEIARDAWARALELEPNGSFGAAAARRLHQTAEPATSTPDV